MKKKLNMKLDSLLTNYTESFETVGKDKRKACRDLKWPDIKATVNFETIQDFARHNLFFVTSLSYKQMLNKTAVVHI